MKTKVTVNENLRKNLSVEYDSVSAQIQEMQKTLNYYKQENMNLKADINYIIEKHEEERVKRNEIELVSFPFSMSLNLIRKSYHWCKKGG